MKQIYSQAISPSSLVPGIDGSALAEASLTDSYFSTSFIGVNGFGSPAEAKYPLMQVRLHLISPCRQFPSAKEQSTFLKPVRRFVSCFTLEKQQINTLPTNLKISASRNL